MIDFAFDNEVAPEHERTSCSDANWNGNQYFNEMGVPRCVRCCLLHRLAHGRWPHDAQFRVELLRAVADFRKSDDMDLPPAPGPLKCSCGRCIACRPINPLFPSYRVEEAYERAAPGPERCGHANSHRRYGVQAIALWCDDCGAEWRDDGQGWRGGEGGGK